MKISETCIVLYVRDQNRSTDFYSRLLGMEPVLHVPGMTEFLIHQGLKLGLMPEKGIAGIISPVMPDPAAGSGIPRCELYLLVEDADLAFNRAVEAGAMIVSGPDNRDWGHRAGYLADADGHVLAFAHII
ncbi:MAG: VOC family protein [Bacteroidia bacterium]